MLDDLLPILNMSGYEDLQRDVDRRSVMHS